MAQAEWLLLARIADLHHVGNVSDELGLLLLAVLFEKIFEEGRSVEVIFDGTLAAAGDDDDVLDAGGYALFRDVLDLRLIYDGQHFLGLRFGGGGGSRAPNRGPQNWFSDSSSGSWIPRRMPVVCGSQVFSRGPRGGVGSMAL